MKQFFNLLLCMLSTLCVGAISGIATASGINNWYADLIKPAFNPPAYLFGPVWTLLYFLMGISLYLILKARKDDLRSKAFLIFGIQLILNFCWSFIFFKFQLLGAAFIEILILWISIIFMIVAFYKISKPAAYLQIPYLLWVSFASILNGAIFWLNY